VVSGIANKIGAALGTLVPTRLTNRVVGKTLRPRYQQDK
jgi:hypothetical protein